MLAAAIATVASMLVVYGHRRGVIRIESLTLWELASRDARFRIRGPKAPKSGEIVIVALDDETRRRRPDLFQTRRGWASLIEAISSYKPELIALDVFFQQPEINLPSEVVEQVRRADAALSAEPSLTEAATLARGALTAVIEEVSGDAILARAIADAGNLISAVVFGFDGEPGMTEPAALRPARIGEAARVEAPKTRRPPLATWVSSTIESIAAGQHSAGFVNILSDADGHVRKMPMVIDFANRTYQSLALSLLTNHLKTHASYVTGEPTIQLGERALPVDHRGRAMLSFLGPGDGRTFRYIPAHQVVAGAVAAELLAGRLVFVGYTDTVRDVVITPFDRTFHGVELHATLAHNIIHNELLREATIWTTLLIVFVAGLLITLLFHRRVRQRASWLGPLVAAAALVVYAILAQLLFRRGFVLDLVSPIGSVILIAIAALTAALASEGREKAQLRTAFSQYVQSTLVDRILADPSRVRLGGVRRNLTVLFSDIRGFSKFSEALPPERLSAFLNEYLTPMTDLVMDAGGMLDKYIGDAIMAVYGAPLEMPNHADAACDSALKMAAALEPLNRDWVERGLPEIHIGIGINSGPMSVGNMGSEARFDYTVVGDAVNLGARLEALTKEVGTTILCGTATVSEASDRFVFRMLGTVRIHGREASAEVYELVGHSGASPLSAPLSSADLEQYEKAVAAFQSRDWEQAQRLAGEFRATHPHDGPVAHLLEEIAAAANSEPAPEWDGAFRQRAK